jgi:integrase
VEFTGLTALAYVDDSTGCTFAANFTVNAVTSGTTEALRKLREMTRAQEDGLALGPANYTVRQAVEDWLAYGQLQSEAATQQKNRHLCETHVLPHLGARKLRELTAVEVDRWLHSLAGSLSTSSLRSVRACLNRSVRRAMARDLVQRNVVELCQVPHGRSGRPSKSLTLEEARGVLTLTVADPLHAYIVVSLLTGARTEELRALRWEHVHLDPAQMPGSMVPPHVEVWRSVRANSETKTKKSRRTLALPSQAVVALRAHRSSRSGSTFVGSPPSRVGWSSPPRRERRSMRPTFAGTLVAP